MWPNAAGTSRRKQRLLDPPCPQKLRLFIFALYPQPFDPPVFAQCRTGKPKGQQEPSLKVVAKPGRPANSTAWNGGIMGSMKKWMLAAALAAGTLALAAAPAQAARIGVFVGARGLHSAFPWTGICLGGWLLRQRLLGAGLLELRPRRLWRPRDSRRRGHSAADRSFITATSIGESLSTGILAPNIFAGSSSFCCLHYAASPAWRGRFFLASFGPFARLIAGGEIPLA